MKKYILFDLDGTLTDSGLGITTCVQYALDSMGIHEPDLSKLTPFIGPPLLDSFMEFYGFSKNQAQKAVDKYRERFSDVGIYENELYPGIEHMLKILCKKKYILGIASSKPTVFVEKILEHFKIKQYFKVIMGSELDGRRSKKEEVIKEALKKMSPDGKMLRSENVFMVGDRSFDVEGAKQFNIECIGVTYGYGSLQELKEAKAAYIVESVEELEEFILRELEDIPESERKITELPIIAAFIFFILFKFAISFLLVSGFREIEGTLPEGLWKICFYKDESGALSIGNGVLTLITILSYGLSGLLLYLLDGKKQIRKEWKVTRLRHLRTKKKYVYPIAIICGILACIGTNGLIQAFGLIEKSESYQEVANNQFSAPFLIGLLCFGLVTPLAEEIVFRGIIFTRTRRIYNFAIAMLVSAISFGIYHTNIVQGTYAFVMGCLMAAAYEYFGSFLWPVFIHMIANTVIFVLGSLHLDQSFLFSLPVAIAFTVIWVLEVFALYIFKRKNY